jgi:processive 1,2-diacylglycerol beta-glucosyltransferase
MTKLLILSSDTGEGHNSAAAAIENAARSAGFRTKIRKPLEESSKVNRSLANFYNRILTHRPQWMGLYFKLIDLARPNDREFFYTKLRRYLGRFIESEGPQILLSVHPMLNHFLQRYVKEERLGIPCYTFLTDPFPPFWRGWTSRYVDRYFVVTDDARESLAAEGVPAWRIERVPMPVRPQFRPATMTEIQEFRRTLHLDNAAILLLNGGARGGGPILKTYETIRQASPGLNILVVCGRNSRLRRTIERKQDSRTRTFGFLEDIHRYVSASDLVVTKPGALSTYEALACGVPILFTGMRGLMPQESGLFSSAARFGIGYSANTFEELDAIIRKGPADWSRKREAVRQFYTASSANELIERIQPVDVGA